TSVRVEGFLDRYDLPTVGGPSLAGCEDAHTYGFSQVVSRLYERPRMYCRQYVPRSEFPDVATFVRMARYPGTNRNKPQKWLVNTSRQGRFYRPTASACARDEVYPTSLTR